MIWTVFPQDNEPAIHPVLDFATLEEAQEYADSTGVECMIEQGDGELV